MTLSFLQHGVTETTRNNKRKAKVVLITWDKLTSHFKEKLKDQSNKLIRETQWAKGNNPDYPMEARMMFGNANVPFGYHGGTQPQHLVKSIPCKDETQGKKQLNEFIAGLENDIDVQKVVAEFVNGKKGFDATTIPSELLGEAL